MDYPKDGLDEASPLALPDAMTLQRTTFDERFADEEMRESVQASARETSGLGAASTPTVFFGVPASEGIVQVSAAIAGIRSVEEFAKRLDSVLGGTRTGWLASLGFGD